MKVILVICGMSAFAFLARPFRWLCKRRPARLAQIDAATYSAMLSEAERIAAPFKRHVGAQLLALGRPPEEELGGDFPEVAALLERAGIRI